MEKMTKSGTRKRLSEDELLLIRADKLKQIKRKIQTLLDEAVEVLMECPAEIAYQSYDTWVSRIDTALTDKNEYCLSSDYTMEDAIMALKRLAAKLRRAAA